MFFKTSFWYGLDAEINHLSYDQTSVAYLWTAVLYLSVFTIPTYNIINFKVSFLIINFREES